MIPCWNCTHFDGLTGDGTAALCNLPDGPRVRSQPHQGCSASDRVPGIDDSPEPPAGYTGASSGVDWRSYLPR